jgi:hypothetical protein
MATGCLFSSADVNPWPAPLPLGAEAGSTEPSILQLCLSLAIFAPLPPPGWAAQKETRNGRREKRKRLATWGKKGPTGCEIDSESQNGQTQYRTTTRSSPASADCFNQPPKKKKRGERRGGAWRPKHKCGTTKKMMKQTSSTKRPFS